MRTNKPVTRSLAALLAVVLLALAPAPAFAANAVEQFSDVAKGAWYEKAVNYAVDNALMGGTAPDRFSPDAALTRAQLLTILWAKEGKPVVNYAMPYSDVAAESWYEEAIRWAAAEGVLSQKSGAVKPNEVLTREETAVLLRNYAAFAGADTSIGENTNILSYSDAFEISEGYASALQWAVAAGVISGTSADKLSPKGTLTRAQAAAMLMVFDGWVKEAQPLSLWTEDARAKKELTAYIEAVTDPESPDFIPETDRIAVFDLDGTLFCETDPNYFDYTLLKYRVLEDPDYKDKASDFEKEVANKIREQNETGASFSGLEIDHGKAVSTAFAGMTVDEFNAYIQEFKKQPMPSYDGMLRGEGWYKPMLQIVDYLQRNDFTVYIVSGTDRFIVRGIVENSPLNIPSRQIIGSDELLVADHQGETDGLQYVFTDQDKVVLGGEFLIKNLKMNKVSVILQEIGQQPVLSFGNSTGDSSMAEYVTTNNKYESLAFMLCCDDIVRENGSESKAQKMFELCGQFDWIPISMKNDWTTIYGDGVTKK
ncbi:MAG: S-layer homology domain-containing protein [Firmicutes bacterium]|nr:S-layer homology domain-containing protein [Bacillota bacterium]